MGNPVRDHAFGASAPFSLGVEEELLLVDERLALTPVAEATIERTDPALRERVSTELFANQIELKTGVCADSGQALVELAAARAAVREAGAKVIGAGIHPDHSGGPELVDKPRYEIVQKDLAGLLDTPPCGLHVHVGMPDPETAVAVANAMRHHLPLLQALTANSPFREGVDTALASARSAVVRAYPRFEMPREFADYEDFVRVADQLILAAGVDDYTYIWWDVRPHPKLGTVEVRGMDEQSMLVANVAVAALIQALAAREVDQPSSGGIAREALEESYYQAGRHGLDARLMVAGGSAEPAREVGRRVLAEVRPYAAELGGEEALAEIERILREGNGADRQRRVEAESGIPGLLEWLAARTAE